MARPTKSSRASVVGAMTRAARASRKRRSTPSSLRKAAPPHDLHREVGDGDRRLAGRRLDLEHPQHGVVAARCRARRACRRAAPRPGRWRCASGRGRPGSSGCSASVWSEVLEPGRGRGGAPVSAVTASISPTLNAALRTRNHGSTSARAMSRPAPSAPSMASAATLTPSAVTGVESLPRSPRPSKAAGAGEARRAGRHQPERHRPVAASGPARPHVAVGLAGRGHPALRRVEAHPSPAAAAVPCGAQKWLREPPSEKASVVRCRPAPIGLADVLGAVGLDHHRGGVVHQDHHRRRAAHLGELPDHVGGVGADPPPPPPTAPRRQPEDPGLAERGDGLAWKRTRRVHLGRPGSDDLVDHPPQRVLIVRHFLPCRRQRGLV